MLFTPCQHTPVTGRLTDTLHLLVTLTRNNGSEPKTHMRNEATQLANNQGTGRYPTGSPPIMRTMWCS
jgi:hypothetical protein